MPFYNSEVRLCGHCGNRTPLRKECVWRGQELMDFRNGEPDRAPYVFAMYSCETCQGASLFGLSALTSESLVNKRMEPLYPRGPSLAPPQHTVVGATSPIPEDVARAFMAAWPLRHTNPTAFANQIRRALEFVCKDRGAVGTTLHAQLMNLAKREVFPAGLAETASLIKEVGNEGSHAGRDIDPWDAELLEELFRSIVDYVYVAPARIARLKQRLSTPPRP